MTTTTPTLNIEILSAGAGSGKTYTLTGRMVSLLQNGVRPAGIMATTFTQKAAAELQDRVRVRLLEAGMRDAANELGQALIGTVHGIGVRLLQRFAFEAGVSPLVEIIAEGDSRRLFNESLSQVLSEKRIETLNLLADRLGLTKKAYGDPFDWRSDIQQLTEVARANNFSKKVLEISKLKSWESFSALLEEPNQITKDTWNNRILSALDQCIAALEANDADATAVTRDAIETYRNLHYQLRYRGELYWHEYIKITKTKIGAKSRHLAEELHELAKSHDQTPAFRHDVKQYIDLVFDIASDALSEYETYKKKRGLIDYTDMETYVSRLLRVPSVQATLSRELDLLLVDEFQDTSPIQLDIFLQISRLAQKSIWVGDPKQSIYGFRGADPALMQAIINATGGVREENILKKSWRSRPDLVHAVNAIFTKAFPNMPVEQVVLEPAVSEHKDASAQGPSGKPGNALVHWHFRSALDEKKVPGAPWTENCIADQIAVMLERKTLIYNKKRDQIHPVKPGDIAVLCRNNRGCEAMAEALHRTGLKAAIARTGLLETPEAKLATACLKYLLTPSDSLSIAEILLLTNSMQLTEMVENRIQWLQDTAYPWAIQHPYLQQLQTLRPRIAELSASEILSVVIDELDLRRVSVALGNAEQRLDNLDRLRRYALDYESACTRLHSAATLGGFLLWLNDLSRNRLDAQGSGESEDAVKVLTYHRSKGLEYPVTICHNLDQSLKEQIWGLNLVPETEVPDLDNILGNRWLRFWVNPYADLLSNTRLDEAVRQSEAFAIATRAALEEEARLLYVGLTRARDYLVFPTTAKPTRWLNRVFNNGQEDIPTLDADSDETPFYHAGLPLYADTEVIYKEKDFGEALPDLRPVLFHSQRNGRRQIPRAPLMVDVIGELPPNFDKMALGEPQIFAPWLEYKGDYSPELNKAVQAVLCVATRPITIDFLSEISNNQLITRQLTDNLNAVLLSRHAEQFFSFLQKKFAPKSIHAQYPLQLQQGKRIAHWPVDLCLENDDMVLVLQFGGFTEGMKKWKDQARNLGPFMGWTHLALRAAFPHKKTMLLVVFGLEGQMVEVTF